MPSEFIIDVEHGVVISKGTGVFTNEDFLEHMVNLSRDKRFQPEFKQIVDCRSITRMDLTAEQIRDFASHSIFSPQSRRAFVVTSSLQFGLSRMFSAYSEIDGAQNIMVFRDMREALLWLDLPSDYEQIQL